jgi:hypothetical protein
MFTAFTVYNISLPFRVTLKIASPIVFVERFGGILDLPDSSAIKCASSVCCANTVELTPGEPIIKVMIKRMKRAIGSLIFTEGRSKDKVIMHYFNKSTANPSRILFVPRTWSKILFYLTPA